MAFFPTRNKVRHQLSSFKDDQTAWVELYTEPDVAEVERVQDDDSSSSFTKGLLMLTGLIQDWGFTDKEGTPAPITLENVRQLGLANINELLELVNLPDEKEPISPKENKS